VWLEPGDTAKLELPIRWNRAARDAEGWNHPRAIEAFVAVSQGRRSGRLSWDVVQRTISDMLDRSDRSPVVERKPAALSFGAAGGSTASNATPPPPLTAVPNKPVAAVPDKPVAAPAKPVAVPDKPVAVPDQPAAATPDKLIPVPDKPAASFEKPVTVPVKPVAVPPKLVAMPAKGAAAIDKRVAAPPDAIPSKPLEIVKPSVPAAEETSTALVIVRMALGPAKDPASTLSPAVAAPAAAAGAVVPAAAPSVIPAAAAVVAPATHTVAPAAAAATATVPESIAQRRPPAQPQPQPKPITPDAPKQQAPEAPKQVRDIAAEVATNFDGYRPAFQLVKSPATSQSSATVGSSVAPNDSTLRVDDLDASIVGSGLNYARSTNGVHVGPPVRRPLPAGAWFAGIAVAAVLGFVLFRPHSHTVQPTTTLNTAAAPVAAAHGRTVTSPAHATRPNHIVAHVAQKPKVAPPSPAAVTQTPAATTPPASQANVARPPAATVTHAAPAHTVVRRPPPVDRSALPTIDYVNATYGRYGRAIRVDWSSTAQAAADVQLTDARGTLIGERAVGAGRSYVVMGLPRGYHGGIFVQVSVTGYHSERVVQTSSLTPF
jgi:hypothetical protein